MAWIHFKGEGNPKKKTSWCRANRRETESGKKSRRFTCLVPSPQHALCRGHPQVLVASGIVLKNLDSGFRALLQQEGGESSGQVVDLERPSSHICLADVCSGAAHVPPTPRRPSRPSCTLTGLNTLCSAPPMLQRTNLTTRLNIFLLGKVVSVLRDTDIVFFPQFCPQHLESAQSRLVLNK